MSDQEKPIRDDQVENLSGGVIPIDPPIHPPTNPAQGRVPDPIQRPSNPVGRT
ncbi:MAG TPA: hypothetical protein VKR56_02310 [Candidatus Cybelea sp.]|nr:hypothetical protein [Candidatus Cybelea sp.]